EESTRGADFASGTSIAQATVRSSIFGADPFDKSERSLPYHARTWSASFSAAASRGLDLNATSKDFGVSPFSCGMNAASDNSDAMTSAVQTPGWKVISVFLSIILKWMSKRRECTIRRISQQTETRRLHSADNHFARARDRCIRLLRILSLRRKLV